MYCTECGKQLDEGWKYCPACGNQIEPSTSRRTGSSAFPLMAGSFLLGGMWCSGDRGRDEAQDALGGGFSSDTADSGFADVGGGFDFFDF